MRASANATVLRRWLRALQVEVENELERRGGFRGPVRELQRPWSRALDQLEQMRQDAA